MSWPCNCQHPGTSRVSLLEEVQMGIGRCASGAHGQCDASLQLDQNVAWDVTLQTAVRAGGTQD